MKTIIAVDGLDAVGKTHYINTVLQFDPQYGDAIFRKFPGAFSATHHYIKSNPADKINPVYMADIMLNEIVSEMWRFYNMPDASIMICDRFLFSNFLYTINPVQNIETPDSTGEELDHFKERFIKTWNQQTGSPIESMAELLKYFNFEQRLIECPESTRLDRIEARKEPDFINDKAYQQALVQRYDNIISDKNVCLTFMLPGDHTGCEIEKVLDFYVYRKGVYNG